MSANPALDQLKALDNEYNQKKQELRNQAIAELEQEIEKLHQELESLKKQYKELVGKAYTPKQGRGKQRRRLTKEQLEALAEKIRSFLATKPDGAKISEILSVTNETETLTRRALEMVPGLRKEGIRASTIYKV
ncbi:MAG: hypothetical protein N2035_04500 [Chthoniobacterales bacterium]|nr:hypothetical protein [Chthoniobacterales bacterium]